MHDHSSLATRLHRTKLPASQAAPQLPVKRSIAISRRAQSCPPTAQRGPHGHATSAAMHRHAGPYALFAHKRGVSLGQPHVRPATPTTSTANGSDIEMSEQVVVPPPPYTPRPTRTYLLVGPAIARHLRDGGGVRVRDVEGCVLGWLDGVDAAAAAAAARA